MQYDKGGDGPGLVSDLRDVESEWTSHDPFHVLGSPYTHTHTGHTHTLTLSHIFESPYTKKHGSHSDTHTLGSPSYTRTRVRVTLTCTHTPTHISHTLATLRHPPRTLGSSSASLPHNKVSRFRPLRRQCLPGVRVTECRRV